MAQKAKKKEKEYVSSLLPNYGDKELLFISWVKKINPKGKVQKRLLALSEHHIFSFKFSTLGKKALQRYGHYFDLKELVSPDKQQLDIQFQSFNIKFNSDDVPKIIKAIRECYMALHPYTPESELTLGLKIADRNSLLSLEKSDKKKDTFETFWKVFTSWNSYLGGSDPSYFREEMQETFAEGEKKFFEIHNPTLRDHLHFKSLCKALLFSDRLTHLTLINYSLTKGDTTEHNTHNNESNSGGGGGGEGGVVAEPLDEKKVWQVMEASLAELLTHSFALRHLTLSGMPLSPSFFKTLSDSLKRKRAATSIIVASPRPEIDEKNKGGKKKGGKEKEQEKDKNEKEKEKENEKSPREKGLPLQLEELDLSETRFGKDEKSAALLADIIKLISKSLAHLNLSGCDIEPNSIHALCEALLFCTGVNLKRLDFSFATFDKDSTLSLSPVLTAGTTLQYLGLRSCKDLDVHELCKALKGKGCAVADLNLAENEIDEKHGDHLASLLSNSTILHTLNLSATNITLPTLAQLLKAIGTNKELPANFSLNVSENSSLAKKKEDLQESLVRPLLLRRSRLHSLNIDAIGLGDEGMQILFNGLTSGETQPLLKELSVSRNLELHKEKKDSRANTAKAINQFIASNPPLESFVMTGDVEGSSSAGADVSNAGNGAASKKKGSSKKKPAIDYGFGPLLGEALASLGDNTGLVTLNITGNDMGDEGVNLLASSLAKNKSLKALHWDSNKISLQGYQVFLSGFDLNRTLIELTYPINDIKAIEAALESDKKKKAKKTELKELLAAINNRIKSNMGILSETSEEEKNKNKKEKEKEKEKDEEKSENDKTPRDGKEKKGSRRDKKKEDAVDNNNKENNKKEKKEKKEKGGKKKKDSETNGGDHKNESEKKKKKKGKGKKEEAEEGKEKEEIITPRGGRALKVYSAMPDEDEGSKDKEAPTQYSPFPKMRKNTDEEAPAVSGGGEEK